VAIPEIRQRAGLLFLAVAVGHIILISAQVNSRSGIPLLHAVVFGAFSRVQQTAATVVGGGQSLWKNYVDLRGVRAENAELRRRNAELQAKLQLQRAQVEEGVRMRQLLDLRAQSGLVTTGALVIAGSVTPDFRTITIDKGRRDGLRAYTAVLAGAGVVGCVMTPSRGTAKVQLLVDRNAAIAALVERSRAQGIVVGTGEDVLRMEYLAATADVKAGDIVLSSGIDGIYPKGFAIGRVERVDKAGSGVKTAVVSPVVDFSALEEVLVVQQAPQAETPQGPQQPGVTRTKGTK
jgi:rod shape-determining protein MreC